MLLGYVSYCFCCFFRFADIFLWELTNKFLCLTAMTNKVSYSYCLTVSGQIPTQWYLNRQVLTSKDTVSWIIIARSAVRGLGMGGVLSGKILVLCKSFILHTLDCRMVFDKCHKSRSNSPGVYLLCCSVLNLMGWFVLCSEPQQNQRWKILQPFFTLKRYYIGEIKFTFNKMLSKYLYIYI